MPPPPKRPPPQKPPEPAEPGDGPSTIFVRMTPDGVVAPPPPPPARGKPTPSAPTGSAPKKGLQVTLPDDDPAPPPPPPKFVPPPAKLDKKGRRGNWWDAKHAKDGDEEEPPAEEPEPPPPEEEPAQDGATAFMKVGEIPGDDPPAEEPAEGATVMFKVDRKKPAPRPAPKADDGEHDGATAFVSAKDLKAAQDDGDSSAETDAGAEPVVAPPPRRSNDDDDERRRKQQEARKKREAEAQAYQPVPAPDYQGNLGRPSKVRTWARRLIFTGLVLGVLGTAAIVGLYFYLSASLPRMESFDDYKPLVSTHVVASDGTQIGEFYKERRTVVPLSKIPQQLKDAVLSAEDKDFYKHHGVSVLGLARAAIVDIMSGKKRQGASTITQQVVKTFFLTGEKRFSRKVKEIVLAFRLEKDLSKDDILALYLNQINFGKAHYGVEEASLYYFAKHVDELELGECALLAGLPQNPGRLNPRFHPASAKRRQTYVLGRMLANKKISQEQHDREVEKPLALPPAREEGIGQAYLEEVKRRMVELYGETAVNTAGMTVEVAMVPQLQRAAEHAVKEGLRAVDKRQGWRGAEFGVGELLEEVKAALDRRYKALAESPGTITVFDLGGIAEQDQQLPDRIARAARIRVLEPGAVYGGLVTKIQHNGIDVQLAPDIVGWVPFPTMSWARPFKPEGATPAPRAPSELVKLGDVVEVSVTKLVYRRTSAVKLRGRELELSLEQTPKVEGAFAAIDLKTRGVVALVGGYDFALSQFNRATQARRQPGSAFKPILYAAAIETARYTPATRVLDTPTPITDPWTGKTWDPKNFEKDEFDGPISLRKALASSKNTVAVKLLLDVGFDKVRAMARLAGLSTDVPKSYTAALGTGEVIPLELINSYATFASLGRKAEPILIKKVRSRANALMMSAEVASEPSIKPEVAYVTADLMRAVIDDPDGTARSLGVLMRPIAGKTGTASEHRDAWFVGFTPSLVAGAWVGFDDHRILGPQETGGHAAGPIWLRFMKAATAGTPIEDWPPPPPGVTVLRVNRNTGALSSDPNDPFGVREVFLAGTEPSAGAPAADQTQFLKE